jgi:hypothetical protein
VADQGEYSETVAIGDNRLWIKNYVAQALTRAKFWEADRRQFADK